MSFHLSLILWLHQYVFCRLLSFQKAPALTLYMLKCCEVWKSEFSMSCRVCHLWQLVTIPNDITLSKYKNLKTQQNCLLILLTFSLSFSENDVLLGCCPAKLCQCVMLNNVLRDVKTTQKQSRLDQQSIKETINCGKSSKIQTLKLV